MGPPFLPLRPQEPKFEFAFGGNVHYKELVQRAEAIMRHDPHDCSDAHPVDSPCPPKQMLWPLVPPITWQPEGAADAASLDTPPDVSPRGGASPPIVGAHHCRTSALLQRLSLGSPRSRAGAPPACTAEPHASAPDSPRKPQTAASFRKPRDSPRGHAHAPPAESHAQSRPRDAPCESPSSDPQPSASFRKRPCRSPSGSPGGHVHVPALHSALEPHASPSASFRRPPPRGPAGCHIPALVGPSPSDDAALTRHQSRPRMSALPSQVSPRGRYALSSLQRSEPTASFLSSLHSHAKGHAPAPLRPHGGALPGGPAEPPHAHPDALPPGPAHSFRTRPRSPPSASTPPPDGPEPSASPQGSESGPPPSPRGLLVPQSSAWRFTREATDPDRLSRHARPRPSGTPSSSLAPDSDLLDPAHKRSRSPDSPWSGADSPPLPRLDAASASPKRDRARDRPDSRNAVPTAKCVPHGSGKDLPQSRRAVPRKRSPASPPRCSTMSGREYQRLLHAEPPEAEASLVRASTMVLPGKPKRMGLEALGDGASLNVHGDTTAGLNVLGANVGSLRGSGGRPPSLSLASDVLGGATAPGPGTQLEQLLAPIPSPSPGARHRALTPQLVGSPGLGDAPASPVLASLSYPQGKAPLRALRALTPQGDPARRVLPQPNPDFGLG